MPSLLRTRSGKPESDDDLADFVPQCALPCGIEQQLGILADLHASFTPLGIISHGGKVLKHQSGSGQGGIDFDDFFYGPGSSSAMSSGIPEPA